MSTTGYKARMANRASGSSRTNFLATTQGRLVTLSAIVAVVAGIVTNLAAIKDGIVSMYHWIHPPQPVNQLIESSLSTPSTVPFRFRSLGSPYVKWAQIKVVNKSKEKISAKVYFLVGGEKLKGPAKADDKTVAWEKTLAPKGNNDDKADEPVNPPLEYLKDDVLPFEELTVKYEIRDGKGSDLGVGTNIVKLLPLNTMDWNLTDENGKQISQKFLFASLATWIIPMWPKPKDASNPFEEEIAQLRKPFGSHVPLAKADRWFASSYAQLFQAATPIEIIHSPVEIPGEGRQVIKMPIEVLTKTDRKADPLEAAILLASLARSTFKHDLRLVLVLFPQESAPPRSKQILLAWSIDSVNWRAISFADANTIKFEDKEPAETQRVAALFAERPQILSQLKENGIYFRTPLQVSVLDFNRASEFITERKRFSSD